MDLINARCRASFFSLLSSTLREGYFSGEAYDYLAKTSVSVCFRASNRDDPDHNYFGKAGLTRILHLRGRSAVDPPTRQHHCLHRSFFRHMLNVSSTLLKNSTPRVTTTCFFMLRDHASFRNLKAIEKLL